MFRLLRAVFMTNPQLSSEGGFVFNWMVDNYVDAGLMLIRREVDIQGGTENLRNLLLDMIAHPTVATRGRYLAKWGTGKRVDPWFPNRSFDGYAPVRISGDPEADQLNPEMIRRGSRAGDRGRRPSLC